MKLQHIKIYFEIIISPAVVRRAIQISLIVGTTLNLINQGEVFM